MVKLKKLNKIIYNKVITVENEKSNLSKVLKIAEVEISRIKAHKDALEKELNNVQKDKQIMANKKLDKMLSLQKFSANRTGLRYSNFREKESLASSSATTKGIGRKPADSTKLSQGKIKNRLTPICHHCGIKGHTRPYCFNRR